MFGHQDFTVNYEIHSVYSAQCVHQMYNKVTEDPLSFWCSPKLKMQLTDILSYRNTDTKSRTSFR